MNVKNIYKAIRQTLVFMKKKYHYLTLDLPKTIYFITSQELEDMYPDKMPAEREQLEKAKCTDRLEYPYYQKILKKELTYTISEGIGRSRIFIVTVQ